MSFAFSSLSKMGVWSLERIRGDVFQSHKVSILTQPARCDAVLLRVSIDALSLLPRRSMALVPGFQGLQEGGHIKTLAEEIGPVFGPCFLRRVGEPRSIRRGVELLVGRHEQAETGGVDRTRRGAVGGEHTVDEFRQIGQGVSSGLALVQSKFFIKSSWVRR